MFKMFNILILAIKYSYWKNVAFYLYLYLDSPRRTEYSGLCHFPKRVETSDWGRGV